MALRSALIGASSALFVSFSATAATRQWDGGAGTGDWQTAANWKPDGLNIDFNGTFGHRLNVNGTQELVYTSAEGTTNYKGGTDRGLVVGSATSGSMTIAGGTFSTLGTISQDIIGNGNNSTGVLTINGGNYIGTSFGTNLGLGTGVGRVSTLNVPSGSATIATLTMNSTLATINLGGAGVLEVNKITKVAGSTANLNIDGGTLRARQNETSFVSGLDAVNVLANGAVIDTNGFDVTIGNILREDANSTGGGLIKKGAGLLKLGAPSTITGVVDIQAGGLGLKASSSSSWQPSGFTFSGDALHLDLGVYDASNPAVIEVPALNVGSQVTVNVTGSNFRVGQIPLIQYQSKNITGSLALNTASLPPGVSATLVDNGTDLILLDVTQAATIFEWSGDFTNPGAGNWDGSSQNWNNFADAYSTDNAQIANFPGVVGGCTVTITGNYSPLVVNITNMTGSPFTFDGAGKLTGATALNKSNTGRAVFASGTNDYSGATTISGGALIKRAADATTGRIIVANDNASFVLDGGITDGAGQTLHLAGRGITTADYFYTGSTVQRGALQAQQGANTWEGDIVLTSDSTTIFNRIGVQNGASLSLTGNISESVPGAYLLFRAGASGDDITLGGPGTYSYTKETQMFSNGGAIILGNDDKLPTGIPLNLTSGGSTVFDMHGHHQQCGGIYSGAIGAAATITNNGAGPSVLTTTPPAATSMYLQCLIADGLESVSLVKNGEGTQVLAYGNTYSGTTTVNAGRLEINADQFTTGDVVVNGGNLKLSSGKHLASGANVKVASGAFLYLDGSSQTLGKFEGSGTVDFTYTAAGTDTLTVGELDQSSTFDGVIRQSTVRTYALTKIGAGTFTMTGLNTYTGDTTVEDGTLSVAQSNFADTSKLTIGTAESSLAVLHLPNAGTDVVAALVIDGVSQPGDGAIYDAANSGGAITGSGRIQVGTPPVTGFAAWITRTFANGTVPAGQQGAEDDPDQDGVESLLEFVLNGDPTVPDSSILPLLAVTPDAFEFTYQRRDDSVSPQTTQTFEWGTTLAAWPGSAIVPATSGPVLPATVTISAGVPDDAVTDTVKVSIPRTEDGGGGVLFGRLRVNP
jgi:autotransporter-associated beta strand protein